MSNLLEGKRFKIALGAMVVAALIFACAFIIAPSFAKADDNEETRTVHFIRYDRVGGEISPESVEFDSTGLPDTYTISFVEDEENNTDKLMMFQCGSFAEPLTVTFFDEGHCTDIMFMDEFGNYYDPGDEINFSELDPEGTGENTLYIIFYGSELELGWVYGTPDSKHDHFELNVQADILGSEPIPLWELLKEYGVPEWELFQDPEYIFEYMVADESVVAGRPYRIDADGTLHVQVGITIPVIGGIEADLIANAVGTEGAVFDHWILNDVALKNGTSGNIPEPVPIPDFEGVKGYELVATYYTDEETATVTFDSCGGSEVASQTVVKGQPIVKPEDPSKGEGYMFDGWFTNPEYTGALYDFTQPVNSNFTLYAKWIELPKVVEGDGQVWYFGSLDNLSFTTSAKYENFVGVGVDGDEVDSSAYTVEAKDNGTVVSLKSEYLTLMTDAEHHIGIVSVVQTATQGPLYYVTYASFTTTVEPIIPPFDPSSPLSPTQTGDFVLWMGLMIAALSVLGFGVIKLRRNRSNS